MKVIRDSTEIMIWFLEIENGEEVRTRIITHPLAKMRELGLQMCYAYAMPVENTMSCILCGISTPTVALQRLAMLAVPYDPWPCLKSSPTWKPAASP